uniref:Uncharacterized protein n=1 Tax=Nelumbo nucifera TaxID=4432 RepID=A0A822ZMH0_NELNU|nr:TPA_asm: hypothetical protein HUJ06_016349 [Nelumbo nucifera]
MPSIPGQREMHPATSPELCGSDGSMTGINFPNQRLVGVLPLDSIGQLSPIRAL